MDTAAQHPRIGTKDHGRSSGRPISYREVPERLSGKVPFAHRSMSAQVEGDGSYVVYSYATCIAVWAVGDGASVIDSNHWGPTTGRHINLCRTWL